MTVKTVAVQEESDKVSAGNVWLRFKRSPFDFEGGYRETWLPGLLLLLPLLLFFPFSLLADQPPVLS